MPKESTLSSEDKAKVKKAVPTSSSSNKIVTAAVARVYQAKENSRSWNYAGAEGALVFCADRAKGGLWFRVVDLTFHRGVIWEHELPNEIEYNQEKPFFHTWQADSTQIAFVFAAAPEANDFYKKVANRSKYATKVKEDKKEKTEKATPTKKSKKKGGAIDKSLISGPSAGSFKHVAHMGFDSEKGFSSSGVDPSWQALLEQLSSKGISPRQIQKNQKFIEDFVQQQGGIENASTPNRAAPPPAPTSRRKPAPPPPSRPRPTSVAAPSIPPPPPPPSSNRSSMPPAIPTAPPPPTQSSGVPPPPPPPPVFSPPSRASALPPPPPPPTPGGRSGGPPPPPPPPPPASTGSRPPAPAEGRSALLASIQGQGVHALKRVDPNQQRMSPLAGVGVGVGVGGGAAVGSMVVAEDNPDLASSLAAALARRKGDLGDSDEEEESDGEWE